MPYAESTSRSGQLSGLQELQPGRIPAGSAKIATTQTKAMTIIFRNVDFMMKLPGIVSSIECYSCRVFVQSEETKEYSRRGVGEIVRLAEKLPHRYREER
jgi:hypothetical protein